MEEVSGLGSIPLRQKQKEAKEEPGLDPKELPFWGEGQRPSALPWCLAQGGQQGEPCCTEEEQG